MSDDPFTAAIGTVSAVIRPGHVVLVGELHGTEEFPALVAQVATNVARRFPVMIGLEVPADAIGDRGSSFWRRPPALQDGRSSAAMLKLVQSLGSEEGNIALFSILPTVAGGDPEEAMAERVAAVTTAHPMAAVLVLAGNLHTRTEPHADHRRRSDSMGQRLRHRTSVTSVIGLPAGGTYWGVTDLDSGGGVHVVGRSAPLSTRGVGHDMAIAIGPVSASPPPGFLNRQFVFQTARR